jgi:amino-acid N-acetyltransferase
MTPASTSALSIDPATPDDRTDIADLCSVAGLPVGDLPADELTSFRVLRREGTGVCGIVAVELFGPVALLRSLAVHPDVQGHGLGQTLVLDAEAHARAEGGRAMYLLTNEQSGFFRCLGYAVIDREAVPPVIAETPVFRETGDDAVCMWKQLGASGFA